MHSEPTFFHSYYNNHVEMFELVEDLIKISVKVPLKNCLVCVKEFVSILPTLISAQINRIESFYLDKNQMFDFVSNKL